MAPESAQIVFAGITTPVQDKRIVWFEETEHDMFRDCESEAVVEAAVDYVRERVALLAV